MRRMEEARENELVRLAQGGSTKAFTELEKQYHALVFNVARSILLEVAGLGSDTEAEDVMQDVFEYAFVHIKDYRPGRFYRWLWQLAKNRAYRRRKKMWRARHTEEEYVEEKHGQDYRVGWDSFPNDYDSIEELAALVDRKMEEESELHHAVREVQRNAAGCDQMSSAQYDSFLEHIRSLPKTQKGDLQLTIEGYMPREIARMTGRDIEAVKKNLYRARKEIKEARKNVHVLPA